MNINEDNQVVTLSLQDLHDILASGEICGTYKDGTTMRPSAFALNDEGAANPVAVNLTNRLNDLLVEISNLDCEFHDEFDGTYC
jgi:hypothetical protein